MIREWSGGKQEGNRALNRTCRNHDLCITIIGQDCSAGLTRDFLFHSLGQVPVRVLDCQKARWRLRCRDVEPVLAKVELIVSIAWGIEIIRGTEIY